MIFASLIARIQAARSKRRRYLQLLAEINSMTERDLDDLRADRGELLRGAYQHVYG